MRIRCTCCCAMQSSAVCCPGTPLSEAAISSVVGVSRTPVREALRMLMQESLVNVFPQAGTLVSPVRLGLLHEGRFVRRALECENLVELVKVVTPEQIAELEDLLARQRQVLDAGRPNEFFALDEALHRRLLEFMGRSASGRCCKRSSCITTGPLALRRPRLRTGLPRALRDRRLSCSA